MTAGRPRAFPGSGEGSRWRRRPRSIAAPGAAGPTTGEIVGGRPGGPAGSAGTHEGTGATVAPAAALSRRRLGAKGYAPGQPTRTAPVNTPSQYAARDTSSSGLEGLEPWIIFPLPE